MRGCDNVSVVFCAVHNIIGISTVVLTPTGVSSLTCYSRAKPARLFFTRFPGGPGLGSLWLSLPVADGAFQSRSISQLSARSCRVRD